MNEQLEAADFSITYNSFLAAEQTVREIFNDLPYEFKSNRKKPFIIDAGSYIGIATLFFKKLYPESTILCFEPDPVAFELLQKNIALNKLSKITFINAALSQKTGDISFYGQRYKESPDALGNSIVSTWGLKRDSSNVITVKSVLISSYISSEIDFLKLDIEGAEQQVLEELEQTNKLCFIREMAIEVHQCYDMYALNNINAIINLLERNHFNVQVIEKKLAGLLPKEVEHWAQTMNPQLFDVKAVRL